MVKTSTYHATFPNKYTPPPTVTADMIVPNMANTQIEPILAKKLP